MNFVSYGFVVFFLSLFVLSLVLPEKYRKALLLVGSYLFYATWSIPFIAVIWLTTSFDYWMSRIIADSDSESKKKAALIGGLALNLLVLFYFKYFNFFLDNASSLIQQCHLPLAIPHGLNIILPLGISFYTFEAISYMVDVYRGEKPARSWMEYNFYIMYFPHLISGPIVRFHELARQYRGGLELPSPERVAKGFELIILGYLFKTLIADQAATLADPVFDQPLRAGVFATYLGVLAFTVQIYFDFMGYTHIARGASLFFNLELPLNFNHPYNARNISDFWNRWHMSLSRWIRDYLYFPLGGSRGSLTRTVLNLLLTMTLCGIWHGVGWVFLVWGFYHGILLAGYHLFRHFGKGMMTEAMRANGAYRIAAMALTFIVVMIGWVFFRAPDFGAAASILSSLACVGVFLSEVAHLIGTGHLSDLFTLLLLLFCCFSGPWITRRVEALYNPLPFWLKLKLACLLLLLCWVFSSEGAKTFIYFQF